MPRTEGSFIPSIAGSTTRSGKTHQALLDAFERCLRAGGFAAATSTAVAAEAGVSVGSFYGHFRDRDAALVALFSRRLDELLTAVAEVLTIERLLDDGIDRTMAALLNVTVAHYRDHASAFRAALLDLPSSPALHDVYWTAHGRSEEALVTFIRRAQRAGQVRDGDPVVMARTLLVVIQSANHPLLLGSRRRGAAALEREIGRVLSATLAP